MWGSTVLLAMLVYQVTLSSLFGLVGCYVIILLFNLRNYSQ